RRDRARVAGRNERQWAVTPRGGARGTQRGDLHRIRPRTLGASGSGVASRCGGGAPGRWNAGATTPVGGSACCASGRLCDLPQRPLAVLAAAFVDGDGELLLVHAAPTGDVQLLRAFV